MAQENCYSDDRVKKIYVKGKRFPVKVGMKQVLLTDTVIEGERIPNGSINIYDTANVYSRGKSEEILGKLIEKAVQVVMLGWLNKLLGVVFALIKALLIIGLVIVVFDALYNLIPFVPTDTLDESVLYHPIKDLANTVFPFLKELIFKK